MQRVFSLTTAGYRALRSSATAILADYVACKEKYGCDSSSSSNPDVFAQPPTPSDFGDGTLGSDSSGPPSGIGADSPAADVGVSSSGSNGGNGGVGTRAVGSGGGNNDSGVDNSGPESAGGSGLLAAGALGAVHATKVAVLVPLCGIAVLLLA